MPCAAPHPRRAVCSTSRSPSWCLIQVPLLPAGPPFPGFVNAPVPFLMGACTDHFDVSEVPSHVFVVAIDKGSIHVPADPDVRLPRLPPRSVTMPHPEPCPDPWARSVLVPTPDPDA